MTSEDCESWLAGELAALTKRYNAKLAKVQRSQTAYLIAETIAATYAELPAGSPLQPEIIDAAFVEHGVILPREFLRYVPAMELAEAGSPFRAAAKIVSQITRVSIYSMRAQRFRAIGNT
jgi:hypothetical protein